MKGNDRTTHLQNPAEPAPSNRAQVHLLPYHFQLIDFLVDKVVSDARARLPDLSHAVILMPNRECAAIARQMLLQHPRVKSGGQALLGPRLTSLNHYIEQHGHSRLNRLNRYSKELQLVEVIRPFTHLFGIDNPWLIAQSLADLFDELTLQQIQLEPSAAEFTERIQRAYGSERLLAAMEKEASIIHQLWHAWLQQLAAHHQGDDSLIYVDKLQHAGPPDGQSHIYMAGFYRLYPCEQAWVNQQMQHNCLDFIIQGELDGAAQMQTDDPVVWLDPTQPISGLLEQCNGRVKNMAEFNPIGAFFNTVFSDRHAKPMADRARDFRRRFTHHPLGSRLKMYKAADGESEAHAVELQVRQWLHVGCKRVGIVTEDRRLARRIRALLERANVALQDSAGWALSTTSAATSVERWLQCVELQFDQAPLLDLLKSPFFSPPDLGMALDYLAYRLEQDIIAHENIASGLQRYRKALHYRLRRLDRPYHEKTAQGITALLDHLQSAAAIIQPLHGKTAHPAGHFFQALLDSLDRLGIVDTLQQDAAGEQLMSMLQEVHAAVTQHPVDIHWLEFRAWLGRLLENNYFRPAESHHHVYLLSVAQSGGFHFDALIIAGAEQRLLPGAGLQSAFFNNQVRRQLEIKTSHDYLQDKFYLFRRLLQSAGRVLITCRCEQDGEPIPSSPWLELIQSFSIYAYGDDLLDRELADDVKSPDYWLTDPNPAPAAQPCHAPRAFPPPFMIPSTISASTYQQLMDCPYQYHAANILALAQPEEIRLAMRKSDFGERIHRCLQAFHFGVDKLNPFHQPVQAGNREQAIKHLRSISEKVFRQDIEDNFQHRGWLHRWLQYLPHYIDWQIRRQQSWQPYDAECRLTRDDFIAGLQLRGRLDRIDKNGGGDYAIIDYKTGVLPSNKAALQGEAVQLPFYRLLLDNPVHEAAYLALMEKPPRSPSIEGAALDTLSEQNRHRLETIFRDLKNGKGLPAWGDRKTCQRCIYQGLCRKQGWTPDAATAVSLKPAQP